MEKANRVNPIAKWFRETKSELKKVVWPSFAKVRKNTLIVLIYVTVVAIIIFALDTGITALMGLLIGQ